MWQNTAATNTPFQPKLTKHSYEHGQRVAGSSRMWRNTTPKPNNSSTQQLSKTDVPTNTTDTCSVAGSSKIWQNTAATPIQPKLTKIS